MNLHIESTSRTCYYLDNNEKNALKVVINVLNSLYRNDISMEGEVWSFAPEDFNNLAEQLNEIINFHGVENETDTSQDFSCPTYEAKPNVRISFDEYEEEEEEEDYEED